MRSFDPIATARGWRRPYTSVQWAWVRAFGIKPSDKWEDGRHDRSARNSRYDGAGKLMRQRYGVRG